MTAKSKTMKAPKAPKDLKVVNRILKQLTPERIKKEVEAIRRVKLPPELQKWVKEYEKVGERDSFVWKWLYKSDKVILRSLDFPARYQKLIIRLTFLINLFIVLADDISELPERGELLKDFVRIPVGIQDNPGLERGHFLKTSKRIWQEIVVGIKKLPYYKQGGNIFYYDIKQFLNSAEYSFLICKNPNLINNSEYWKFAPQNMQVIITFDLYLMCVGIGSDRKIGKYRELVLGLQEMARIGNCLATWEREVQNDDFISSGVFAYMTDLNSLRPDFWQQEKQALIDEIKRSGFERTLLARWEDIHGRVLGEIRNVRGLANARRILLALEKITFYHLIGRGAI